MISKAYYKYDWKTTLCLLYVARSLSDASNLACASWYTGTCAGYQISEQARVRIPVSIFDRVPGPETIQGLLCDGSFGRRTVARRCIA